MTVKTLLLTYFALLVLLGVTTGIAYLDSGIPALNTAVALGIAVVKTLLVVLIFMEVRHSSKLIHVFVGAGFFWLALLLALTMNDYLSRGWLATGQ